MAQERAEDDSIYIDYEWEVEDGYCGASRPQSTPVWPEDLAQMAEEAGDDDGALIDLIYEWVYEDLQQKISFSVDNIDDMVQLARECLEDEKK